MHRQNFSIDDFQIIKQKLLTWGSQFGSCCFLDNHQYNSPFHQQECLLAVGAIDFVKANAGKALPLLHAFTEKHKGSWIVGHLAYGLNSETEDIITNHTDNIGFPTLYFFVPETVVQLSSSHITIRSNGFTTENIWEEINNTNIQCSSVNAIPAMQPRISKDDYISTIEKLRAHILRGDCYEINFCQEFFSANAETDAVELYRRLSLLSPNPFSCYYRVEHSHLICASPERYLAKKDNRIFSQPIKGTAARNFSNNQEDENKRMQLQSNAKERSENVMVVDLVRNDLSKVCKEGTVKVDELFGVYTYPQVHQMISTISGELLDDLSFSETIKATFPMGSMTGAPKKRVMELIEKYEQTERGIFSGAVGYISPENNFDFNVVIRSLLYNDENKYLSYLVGSGITWYSQPEQEYEECMLKAAAIKQVLDPSTPDL